MPCQRCGARQGDPSRGPSRWQRAVSSGEQVLICPTCQQDAGWQAGMDRCPSCGSVRLSKTLGVLRCGGCGWSGETSASPEPAAAADDKLADDVRAALGRVLRAPQSGADGPRLGQ
jgi:predicted amidophosphoribosyltransferase